MTINQKIFRDYDIRGTYPDQINEDTYYLLGRAIVQYLNPQKIAVGYDMRLSSPSLFTALNRGIMDQGADVVHLGQISTEMHNFASGKYQFDVNVIISASHNPAEYNGLKIVTKGAIPLHGEKGLPQIRDFTVAQNFPHPKRKGTLSNFSIQDAWVKHLLSFINRDPLKPFSVVIDAGNGMGGLSWKLLTAHVPIKIHELYFDPDGHFPHHLPDPLNEKNLVDIKKTITAIHADLGFAIDGDADRLFVLDEHGSVLSGTTTAAILAKFFLQKNGPAPILYNAVCGRAVPDTVKQSGGTPVRVRVGHSFIKEEMRERNALFAGEHSGHFYFRDNFYADSSTIAALSILSYISKSEKKVSEIVQEIQKYFQSGETNYKIVDALKAQKILEETFSHGKIDHLDGLSISYPDWWTNVRASKTEPFLRVNVEANSSELLQRQTQRIDDLIKSSGGSIV